MKRLKTFFARRGAVPAACYILTVAVWLVLSLAHAGSDALAKAQGRMTEQIIPVQSWQLVGLEPAEEQATAESALTLTTTNGDPQMILEDVSGQVVRTGYNRLRGYYIIIRHEGSVQTLYQHLSYIFVRGGETVTQGQTVAAVGSTGLVTGPHLHLEIILDGVRVDPMPSFPQLAA